MQEIVLTDKAKRMARRTRQRNERKWIAYRVIAVIMLIACLISLVTGVFIVDYSDYNSVSICILFFSITLVGFFATRSLLKKASSHWIQDRLNEKVWIEDGCLYHFLQTSFAAGLNVYNADERAYLFKMDMSTIRNARFDDKSKRIEFLTDGKGFHYADYHRNIIDREWDLNGFGAIFYDVMSPSLYELLREHGVEFEVGTINYRFTNQL